MNLLQVLSTTFRLYSSHIGWYLFAALLLFLAALVGLGLFSSSLLASMVLATPYGPDGEWIQNPMAALLIFSCLGAGVLFASVVLAAAAGAFAHLCAQIGAGTREITVLSFLEYAKKNGLTFWSISMIQMVMGGVATIPFILLAVLLGRVWAPLIILTALAAVAAFFAVQWPVWLAFSAQVVERRGLMASLKSSWLCARRAPMSGLAAVAIWGIAFLFPTPMLIFYPIYFFFIFMPLTTVMGLVYYESSRGMLR